MKREKKLAIIVCTMIAMMSLVAACNDEEGPATNGSDFDFTGLSESYTLFGVGANGHSGMLRFEELAGGAALVTIQLDGTSVGGNHPAHIHSGTAVAGGPIVIPLTPVDGATGESVTEIEQTIDGTPITYNQLANFFDGHVNVHLSAAQLEVLIAQTDIGANVLTGVSKTYPILTPNTNNAIGDLTLAQRLNGQTLITIEVTGDLSDQVLLASIDQNSAAEDGDQVILLDAIENGVSFTNVTALIDGSPIEYNQLVAYNGHVTLVDESGNIVGLGDIGGNELTSTSIIYDLTASPGIAVQGSVAIVRRQNGSAMIQVTATGLQATSTYQLDLMSESAAEVGSVLQTLNPLAGNTGTVQSTVRASLTGERLLYDDLLALDGHIALSANDGTRLAAADVGANELTGDFQEAIVEENGGSGITGQVTFFKRKSGFSLVSVTVEGTIAGASHPIHIHNNSAVEGGAIAVDLTYVDGAIGFSETTVTRTNAGAPLIYDALVEFDGYVAIHESDANITNIISLGDIGQNTLTGRTKAYTINAVNASGISGTVIFKERKNLTTLAAVELEGTTAGQVYPFNIHSENIIQKGPVAITLSQANGNTGLGFSNIRETNGAVAITYDDLLATEFYINVYEGTAQIANLKAQADIGANELTGNSVSYALGELNNSGVTGLVTFMERASGFSIAKLELFGSVISNVHPNHIHRNSIETGGGIILTFDNVVGSPGVLLNHVDQFDDGTPVTYAELLVLDGHVIAHADPSDFTFIAGGNIGINGTPANGRKLSAAERVKPASQRLDYGLTTCEPRTQ